MRAQHLILSALSAAFALAVAVACWLVEHSTAETLRLALDSAQAEARERHALTADLARLRAQLPADTDLAARRAALAERDRLLRGLAARENSVTPAPLSLGEPTPWRSWQNRGQSSPRSTLETALWAAAGGDTRAFASLLELDADTLTQATALLARLPADARQTYASPEALIAGVAMKNIPLGAAQLTWLHESDADHATLGVLLADPDRTSTPPVVAAPDSGDVAPPTLADSRAQKLTFLSLHRTNGTWHLLVPPAALDRVARELGLPTG